MMTCEILERTPISSSTAEFHFGKHFNANMWVTFTGDDNESWTGCFGCSEDKNGARVVKVGTKFATILLNGKLFIVNVNSKELILETEDRLGVEGFVMAPDKDIVAYDHHESVVVYHCESHKIWISKFIQVPQKFEISDFRDGVFFGSVRSFEDFRIAFSVDAESGQILFRDQLFHRKFLFWGKYELKKGTEYDKKVYYVEW